MDKKFNKIVNEYKIIFVVSSISQPRIISRINSFIKRGFEVEVYAFDRDKYNVNKNRINFSYNIIGQIKSGSGYVNKLLKYYKLHRYLSRKYDTDEYIFYYFGFLTALFNILSKRKYIYEISDILYGPIKLKVVLNLMKQLDKRLVKNSIVTLMTSGGFRNYLFGDNYPENILIQPNRVNSYFWSFNRSSLTFNKELSKIRFAFVGAFRYPNTIFRFARVIGENFINHEFHFYGDSKYTEAVKELSTKYENVFYFGEYINPHDLESIYMSIDFIVACYDTSNFNVKIAEPNKMYEAMFFKKPIVVSKGTFVEDQVEKYGCGYAIDATSDDNIISFIKSLSNKNLNKVKDSIDKVDLKELIDDDDKKLISYIVNKLFNKLY